MGLQKSSALELFFKSNKAHCLAKCFRAILACPAVILCSAMVRKSHLVWESDAQFRFGDGQNGVEGCFCRLSVIQKLSKWVPLSTV